MSLLIDTISSNFTLQRLLWKVSIHKFPPPSKWKKIQQKYTLWVKPLWSILISLHTQKWIISNEGTLVIKTSNFVQNERKQWVNESSLNLMYTFDWCAWNFCFFPKKTLNAWMLWYFYYCLFITHVKNFKGASKQWILNLFLQYFFNIVRTSVISIWLMLINSRKRLAPLSKYSVRMILFKTEQKLVSELEPPLRYIKNNTFEA